MLKRVSIVCYRGSKKGHSLNSEDGRREEDMLDAEKEVGMTVPGWMS